MATTRRKAGDPVNVTASPVPASAPVQRRRLQLADIARLAGVSTSTASRALSSSTLVNEETRKRVSELARSLNYTINAGAKSLRLRQNNTVGLVLPYFSSSRQRVTDPFFLALIGNIANALTDRGMEVILSRVSEDHLDTAGQLYDTGRAIGIMVIGQWHHHEQLNELATRQVPLVVWGAQMPHQFYCTVGSDNIGGGRDATRHLLACGRRRIAFLGDITQPEVTLRYQGYLQAHADHGIRPLEKLRVSTAFEGDKARVDIEQMMARGIRFDAVFAASDVIAITAIGVLMRAGLRVPQDVAVVGFDDVELARYYHPSLTTMHQPIEQAAEIMADRLLQIAAGRSAPSHLLPATLVERESTAPLVA
jgi:DNA-binding LacI/PurR family transcriptional regulator